MALPFIAGLAVGAGAVLLWTKNKEVKEFLSNNEVINESLDKGREISTKALQYAKDGVSKASQNLQEMKDKFTSKVDSEEEIQNNKTRAKRVQKTTKKDSK